MEAHSQRLHGKVALVTGAARGIGRGIALCCAAAGADVVVNDLPPRAGAAGAAETAREVERLGRRALAHDADVSDRAQVAGLFEAAVRALGRVDIVVANAAVSVREPTVDAHWEHVYRTIEVAQFGVYHTCQAAARQMLAQGGGGKLLIIGSVLAELPLPTSAPYNMAKAAINQLARTLAIELAAQHINVNVINPGFIDTPGERAFASEEQLAEAGRSVPWGRAGTPDDIGRAAVFLVSADADYITGAALTVDGGFRLGMPQ